MLVDKLPKDENGKIILSPAGISENGDILEGVVDVDWFCENYPDIAEATTPLSSEIFNKLKSIDEFWKTNAEHWKAAGLI